MRPNRASIAQDLSLPRGTQWSAPASAWAANPAAKLPELISWSLEQRGQSSPLPLLQHLARDLPTTARQWRNRRAWVHSLIQSRRGATLSRRGCSQIDRCWRGICTAGSLMLASYRASIAVHHTAQWERRRRRGKPTRCCSPRCSGSLLLTILGAFTDARSSRMAATEATRSPS